MRLSANIVVCFVLIFGSLPSTASADLPDDRVVHVGIHADPTNPNSRVEYYVSHSISAQEQDGDWIAWQIDNYKITEKAIVGSDTVWGVDLPFVDTPDGLWWVEHVDPGSPVRPDFKAIPPVVDTAIANDPADDDLEFDVSEGVYTEPPEGDPWEVTTALDFTFTVEGEQEPAASGENEMVEIPPVPKPPPPPPSQQ